MNDSNVTAAGLAQIQQRIRAIQLPTLVTLDPVVVATEAGRTTALAMTSISLADAQLAIPARLHAIEVKIDVAQTAGTGSVTVHAFHDPSHGGSPFSAFTNQNTPQGYATGLLSANKQRVSYRIDITGTPTFTYGVYVCAFMRTP